MSLSPSKVARKVLVNSAFAILRSPLFARLLPFQKPPLLILSYPRSGSSWVGKVLSTSPSTAYLREPITQQYMFKYGGEHAIVDVDRDRRARSIYKKLSDESFRGIPTRHVNVVNNFYDFMYPRRTQKRIMIKEVNPRAAGFYCEKYQPRVMLLMRHPAAVALSFYQLGWLESEDTQLETGNPSANAWEKFGHAYGAYMHDAIQTLERYGNYEVVMYRRLAQDPYNEFEKLFRSSGLELPADYDDVIRKYCYSSKETKGKADIERTSRNMIFKWKNELNEQQIIDLQRGFLCSKLDYYREDHDWSLDDAEG